MALQRTKDLEKSNEKIEQQKLELEKTNLALKQLTYKDPLTGIWNRRKYDQTIEMEWSRCLRYKRPISLILLDIDYFKEFNDSYGHMAGDECLIQIGETLKNSLSRSESIRIPHEKSPVSNYVTVRIGVASTIPDNNTSYENLFKAADRALYQAKNAGKNQVSFLSE